MPWKVNSKTGERLRFVLSALKATESFARICCSFGISRRVGYKWLRRFKQGGCDALADRPRRPRRCPTRIKTFWLPIIRSVRRRHRRWGAKKIRVRLLGRRFKSPAPSVRTIGRYLKRLQLIGRRPQRARHGPLLLSPPLTRAYAPNEVWTVDFKGRFHTQDGDRAEPLTVRDLFSRYILEIRLLADQRELTVRRAMQRCFKRYGLPRVIRVDNGPPFGGNGSALGLSHLSVWWLRLNIRVEFGRPARPQDNAAHEQMHRVLKAETATPSAKTVGQQQQRSQRWRHHYNHERPHEALNQQVPALYYHPSRRRFSVELKGVGPD
jgi:putative transposase